MRFVSQPRTFQNSAMNIGKVIRALRTERGDSLEKLAFEAGTDASNLSRVERGLQQPSEDALKAIAMALHTSVAELYALAEGRSLAASSARASVHPDDLGREAVQMRRYFRSLSPEYQKLALEIVKTLVRTQTKN